MCGDGANDCGALKAAHTGISLSEAESSVASPFTSKNPNITCVLNVIREGRAALVTSFGIFKYMAAYSLCQFISVMILYSIESNLTDIEFLYIDLFIISIFAFFFGRTEAYEGKLVSETPLNSLISFTPVFSLFLQLILVIFFQVLSFEHLKAQDWYVPFNISQDAHKDDVGCYENYAIFTISSFQYIILAIVFSKGKPYRKSIFTNYGLIVATVGVTAFSVFLAFSPVDFLSEQFELVIPKDVVFRLFLMGYALLNFVISLLVEIYIVDHLVFKKLRFKFHKIDKSKRKYLVIERDMDRDGKWPILTSNYRSAASPLTIAPQIPAEIVIETEKPEPNYVLKSLLQDSDTMSGNAASDYDLSNKVSDGASEQTTPYHLASNIDCDTTDFSEYNTPSRFSSSQTEDAFLTTSDLLGDMYNHRTLPKFATLTERRLPNGLNGYSPMRSKSHTNSPFHAEKIVPIVSSSAQEVSATRRTRNTFLKPSAHAHNGVVGGNNRDNVDDPRSLSLNGLDSLNAPSLNALSRTPPVNGVTDAAKVRNSNLELDDFVEKR